MLGAIIGDISGSYYEVEEAKNKNRSYEDRIKILDKDVPLFTKDSSYTDDTVLTVAIAKALLTDKNYEKHLRGMAKGELYLGLDKYGRSRFGKGFCDWVKGNYIGESYGNGCAMRISPIANYYNDIEKILCATNKATYPSHNNTESYDAAQAVSLCIYFSKIGKSKEFIKKFIQDNFNYNLNYNLEELQRNYKFTSRAKDSIPQAIYCFLISNDFEDSIRKAISIGGDTDTIAAITGSIAESYYGIDENLIKQVEKYLPEKYINIINDFYKSINKKEPFKNELKDFFKSEGMYREDFFDYIKEKVKVLPSDTSLDWFGCFPILKNNILVDIRLLVPEIKTKENMLVNIHEYTHALDLYSELHTVYVENKEDKEQRAKAMEKIYEKKSI